MRTYSSHLSGDKKVLLRINVSLFLLIIGLILRTGFGYAEDIVAIRGGTILTMAGQPIKNGIVLIIDGKIRQVGPDVQIPSGATTVDAAGKYVMPGIVDAMTYFGIKPFELNDTSDPVTPQNKIIQAYYPFGEPRRGEPGIQPDKALLSGGVTTVYIAPGNGQVIAGQGAVVKTFGQTFDSMILREPAAMDMTFGAPPIGAFKETGHPKTRMGIAALMRNALADAQNYRQRLAYTEEVEEGKKPGRDLAMEAMVKLLNREMPARVEAEHVDDIRSVLRIAKEFNLDLVIDNGLSAYMMKDILAKENIPVVVGPISHPFASGRRDPYSMSWNQEDYALVDERNAAWLTEAGVKVALGSFGAGAGGGRWLMLEAGLATGFGLSEEDALKAITINAAEILGVDDRVGSLVSGKDGDVLILNGPPLKMRTMVEKVYLEGRLVYERVEKLGW